MAILIDEKKRVLVQGITGREGRARTRLMREYGTNVVGGVTPGKGGQSVLGVPVFNTPQEAVNSLGNIDVSVVFVPAAGVKDAAISAIETGIKLAVLVPESMPVAVVNVAQAGLLVIEKVSVSPSASSPTGAKV